MRVVFNSRKEFLAEFDVWITPDKPGCVRISLVFRIDSNTMMAAVDLLLTFVLDGMLYELREYLGTWMRDVEGDKMRKTCDAALREMEKWAGKNSIEVRRGFFSEGGQHV
jgi:hypothetical protein